MKSYQRKTNLKDFIKNIIPDFLLLVGVVSLIYGIYLVYLPAAFMVFGLLLIITFKPVPKINNNNNNTGKNRK